MKAHISNFCCIPVNELLLKTKRKVPSWVRFLPVLYILVLVACQSSPLEDTWENTAHPTSARTKTNPALDITPTEFLTPEPTFTPITPVETKSILQLTYMSWEEENKIGFFAINLECPEEVPPCFSEPELLFYIESVNHPLFQKHSWSPNGKRVVFALNRDGKQSDLFLSGSNWEDIVNITGSSDTGNFAPDWSPNGDSIVYISCSYDQCSIRSTDPMGISSIALIENPGGLGDPSWAPDGSHLLFTAWPETENYTQMFSAHKDGSSPSQLTHSNKDNLAPDYSPDGDQIVFARHLDIDQWGDGIAPNLVIMDADGSNETSLTEDINSDFDFPAWSPFSDWIAFNMQKNEGGWDIYIMKPDGKSMIKVTDSPEIPKGAPAWRIMQR